MPGRALRRLAVMRSQRRHWVYPRKINNAREGITTSCCVTGLKYSVAPPSRKINNAREGITTVPSYPGAEPPKIGAILEKSIMPGRALRRLVGGTATRVTWKSRFSRKINNAREGITTLTQLRRSQSRLDRVLEKSIMPGRALRRGDVRSCDRRHCSGLEKSIMPGRALRHEACDKLVVPRAD
jgi:hypothetical protein